MIQNRVYYITTFKGFENKVMKDIPIVYHLLTNKYFFDQVGVSLMEVQRG